MYLVELPRDCRQVFLTENRAVAFAKEHSGIVFSLTFTGKMGIDTAVAWQVKSEIRGESLFVERSRALQYCTDSHGTIRPLFKSSQVL